jgi:hypothetical protein
MVMFNTPHANRSDHNQMHIRHRLTPHELVFACVIFYRLGVEVAATDAFL